MIKISKDNFEVEINEFGGTLSSIKKDGIEYLWQGSEDSWTGKDVVIFPFVARLKDGFYTVDEKEYRLKTHGLLRYDCLQVEEKEQDRVVLSYKYSQDTLKEYPYKFEFYVTYKVLSNSVTVTYKVVNTDNKTIYFGLGGHPALKLPLNRKEGFDDISGNTISFEKEINVNNYELDESGCHITKKVPFGTIKDFALNKEMFDKYKTFIFTDAKFNNLVLKRSDGVNIKMQLNNPPVLALWTKETYGSYICIEPWYGIPDTINPNRELKDKELIQSLEENKEFEYSYSIEI